MKGHNLIELLRPPRTKEALQALGSAVVVAAICWYFGVDVWHSILLGCAVTVAVLAGLVALSAPAQGDHTWLTGKRTAGDGSRGDVATLSSSLSSGSWGLVGLTAERRLHQIARRRLALEGLDLVNPDHRLAIEGRIGAHGYRVLVRRPTRRMRLRTLTGCLDALDALDPTYYPAKVSPGGRWMPRLIPSNLGRIRDR